MRFNAMGPALLPLLVSTAENDVVKWYVGRSAVVPDFQGFPLTLRRLMSYIYGGPILDVSRSHTTTHHSR